MDINIENVLDTMLSTGAEAFEDGWDSVKTFAPAEFKKIGVQIVEIAENVIKYELDEDDGYSPETGKLLLQMQRNATVGALVAISTLTLIAVQNAINAIFQVLKDVFFGVLSSIL